MDNCEANQQEREVGHIPSEMEWLDKALQVLGEEINGLITILTPVIHSSTTAAVCDASEPEARSDCPLAGEITSSRRTAERLAVTIRELKDRLEV